MSFSPEQVTQRGESSIARLTDHQTSLALFAEAIVGVPVLIDAAHAVDEADDATSGAEDVDPCWPWIPTVVPIPPISKLGGVPPVPLLVPAEISLFSTGVDNRVAYRTIVLHQLMVRRGRPSADAIDVSRHPVILVMLEDLRADAASRVEFPGTAAGIDMLAQHIASSDPRERSLQGDTDQADWLELVRLRSLGVRIDELLGRWPRLDERAVRAVIAVVDTVDRAEATFADSVGAADQLARLMKVLAAVAEGHERDLADVLDEAESFAEGSGVGVSLDAGKAESTVSADVAGGHTSDNGATDQQEAEDSDESEGGDTDGEDEAPTKGFSLPEPELTIEPHVRTFAYDEWDYRSGQFRRAWCRVVERPLDGVDGEFIAEIRHRHRHLGNEIRARLARLRPRELVRVHRAHDGEEVDIDAAIAASVDRRRGAPADDRLHVRRDRARRDIAAAFLVDLSASTGSPAVPPEPHAETAEEADGEFYDPSWFEPQPEPEPVRQVLDVAKEAVALMSDALNALGDSHAIYGFSGRGRDHVDFVVSKDFDQSVSPQTWGALSAMKPLQYTRMGPAIRHAAAKLMAQPSRTRLLVVLSDGYPQDVDYGDDRRDREYGMHDTAEALREASMLGVETFCVTIDPAGHDYLREMCPDENYLVIDEVESLPEELAKVYLALSS